MAKKKKLKLTTRSRHAVMAMVEIARHGTDTPLPLSKVAHAGDISLSYLEQLFSGLRRHGLVTSFRGPGGGYMLAKPAGEIAVSDILLSAEDCAPARRTDSEGIAYFGNAQTQALWTQIGEILHAALRNVSLDDVLHGRLGDHPALGKMFTALG